MYITWHSWGLIVVIMVALRADMPAGITLHDERSWHKESCCRWDRRSWCGVLLRWLAASASTDWLWSCSVAESAVKKRDAHVELQSWNHMQSGAIKKKKKKDVERQFLGSHSCRRVSHMFTTAQCNHITFQLIEQIESFAQQYHRRSRFFPTSVFGKRYTNKTFTSWSLLGDYTHL